jgi:hypothetical protein
LCSEDFNNIEIKVKDLEVYNPITEILSSRIQSNKQHCPKCNVPVTDIVHVLIVKPVLIPSITRKLKYGIVMLILLTEL